MPLSPDLYLDVNEVRLRYRDEGRGEPVMFLHGWTLDLEQWDFQAEELSRDHRVLRLDRRGFGLSSGAPSLAGDLKDLAALCAYLSLDRVALVGMSQGARVAAQFAAAQPQALSCLVLDGPPNLLGPATLTDVPMQRYRELTQAHGLGAFRREWSGHGLVHLRGRNPEARTLLDRMLERYPGRDLTSLELPEAPAADFQPPAMPVLLLSGEFDLDSRKHYADAIAARLEQVERARIPGAGHLSNLDNPPAYCEALRRFLRRCAVTPTHH